MDNKQAIEIIKILQDFYSTNEFTDVPLNEKDKQALDIAIKSLEKLDKIKFEVNWLDNVKKTEFNYDIAFSSIKKIVWDWSD